MPNLRRKATESFSDNLSLPLYQRPTRNDPSPWAKFKSILTELYEMGRSDPKKVEFAVKMGVALAIVSGLIFVVPLKIVKEYSIWAVLTVVVVFEFSIGKGFSS